MVYTAFSHYLYSGITVLPHFSDTCTGRIPSSGPSPLPLLRELPRVAEEDTQQGHPTKHHRIIQVSDNVERRKSGQLCRNQHLRPVRNDSLHHTREGVQQTGTLALVDPEALGNVRSQRTDGNDGNRIVGRTEVGHTHQQGDAQFRPLLLFT